MMMLLLLVAVSLFGLPDVAMLDELDLAFKLHILGCSWIARVSICRAVFAIADDPPDTMGHILERVIP